MVASLQPLDTDTDIKVVQQLMELGDVNARAGQVSYDAVLLERWFHADVKQHAQRTSENKLLLHKVILKLSPLCRTKRYRGVESDLDKLFL